MAISYGKDTTTRKVVVRQVWASNLLQEICYINQALFDHTFVAIDTEFPGTIYQPAIDKAFFATMNPNHTYFFMKSNVEDLKLIQLGLTLTNAQGKLPNFGSPSESYIWQFNFRDFDMTKDLYNRKSIEFLTTHGIDFESHRNYGIHTAEFAWVFLNSNLVAWKSNLTWVTFHGGYDFGFMIKILTQDSLPSDLPSFIRYVVWYFGNKVYDVKQMIKPLKTWYGGLNKLAKGLNVERQVGNCHQAGSDSLLTIQTYWKLVKVYEERYRENGNKTMSKNERTLYGLEIKVAERHVCNTYST
ncbi:hypothetical protein ACFE04_031804 [Oxalis oulophora]